MNNVGCKRLFLVATMAAVAASAFPAEAAAAPFRQGMAAMAAGIYSGECINASDNRPQKGSITILKTGQLTAPGVNFNLTDSRVTMTFIRNLNAAGAATSAQFVAATVDAPALTLMLGSEERQDENSASAMVRTGAPGPHMKLEGIRCAQSPQVTSLKAANATSFAMPFLLFPKRQLTCTDGSAASQVDVEITSLQVKFGSAIMGLGRGLKTESFIVTGEGTGAYAAEFQDGREFSSTLSAEGKLLGISVRVKAGAEPLICFANR